MGLFGANRQLACFGAGVILLAVAFLLGMTGWAGTHAHTADVEKPDNEGISQAVDYTGLSERGQETIDRALDSGSTVWRSDSLDAFVYQPAGGGETTYPVEYQDRTVWVTVEQRDRKEALLVGSLRLSSALAGTLLILLGGIARANIRYQLPDNLVQTSRHWIPILCFLLLALPAIPVVFFAGLEPWRAPSPEPWTVIVASLVAFWVAVGAVAASTAGFRHLVGVDRVPFTVSVGLVPLLWSLAVWVVVADSRVVPIVILALAGTIIIAVIGNVLGWKLHDWARAPTS